PTGTFTYGERGEGPSMLTGAGANQYSYDELGQLEQYNTFDLTFNPEGQLVRATREGKALSCHYDAWGQRRIAIAIEDGLPSRVQRFATGGHELREKAHRDPVTDLVEVETEEIWQVSTPAAMVEVRRADGIEVDAPLLAQLRQFEAGQQTDLKPLVEEYMDLDGDGDGVFDAQDLAEAEQAFELHRKAGGPRHVWTYHHSDLLGATTHVTDSTGALVAYQSFHPYGLQSWRRGAAVSVGYAGAVEEVDGDLGLLYFGARYYAPALGRWISPDRAIGESAAAMLERVLESSLYNYSANNPIGRRDPSGQASISAGEAISAAAGGFAEAGSALVKEAAIGMAKNAAVAWLGPPAVLAKMVYDTIEGLGALVDALEHA
ncbi:MAG: RHS repeat-associated core domain-containing protein, partial [Candidatus Devosia euplotis]|nr:RHS repeat-associated core domain-containing protein [Candidatus Devosia euplotis]